MSNNIHVKINTVLTPELILEGKRNDLIHTVNRLRKQKGLNINDRIKLTIPSKELLEEYGSYIAEQTLADEVVIGKELKVVKIDEIL